MDRANFIRRISWAATLILGIVLFGSLVSMAQAATVINPLCGETIGPGGNFVLGGDVGPCSTDPALTVDSAKLDLGGFTVSCDSAFNGIDVVRKKSEVSNGIVSGCNAGIAMAGAGKHAVKNVTARNNTALGFNVGSDGNKLISNTAKDNTSRGFLIAAGADKNELLGNMATGNGGTGFHIDAANDNKLRGNLAVLNAVDGIRIADGGSNNDVLNNIAMGNGDVDLNDENACDNTWKKNLFVTDNEGDGPGAGCLQ